MTSTVEKKSASYTIAKRDGRLVPFRRERIHHALEAAFRDTRKIAVADPLPEAIDHLIDMVVDRVVEEAVEHIACGSVLTVESIQDILEKKLMETNCHDVVRDYIIYREKHKKLRKDSPRSIRILRRDVRTFVRFNPMKIASAVERGFRDTLQITGPTPLDTINTVNLITNKVVDFVVSSSQKGVLVDIETIQNKIEEILMEEGFFATAKDFILYRARRAEERGREEEGEINEIDEDEGEEHPLTVISQDGSGYKLSRSLLKKRIAFACRGYEELVSVDDLVEASLRTFTRGLKRQRSMLQQSWPRAPRLSGNRVILS